MTAADELWGDASRLGLVLGEGESVVTRRLPARRDRVGDDALEVEDDRVGRLELVVEEVPVPT